MEKATEREEYIPFLKAYIENGLLPPIVYKYMPISEYLFNTLSNSELWFSSPASFNDPFDCQIEDQTDWNEENIISFLQPTFENQVSESFGKGAISFYKNNPEEFISVFKNGYKIAVEQGGVTCFASDRYNPLLWAHYSAKHTGVCLVFDIREDYLFFGPTFRVNYVNNYPKLNIIKDWDNLSKVILTNKSDVWKYENEIRTIQGRFGNYLFEKRCLKEIIFGCRTNADEIKTIHQLVKHANYPELKLRKAVLRKNEYAIDI